LETRSRPSRLNNQPSKGNPSVKIILEFGEDETQLADMSYKGPKLAVAAEDFRLFLRNAIKHNDRLSAEQLRTYTDVQERFFECFQGLLED